MKMHKSYFLDKSSVEIHIIYKNYWLALYLIF